MREKNRRQGVIFRFAVLLLVLSMPLLTPARNVRAGDTAAGVSAGDDTAESETTAVSGETETETAAAVGTDESASSADSGESESSSKKKTTGWVTSGGHTYYYKSNGKMARKEWIKYKGHYYYFRKNGRLYEGKQWLTVSGSRYYINGKGYRVTGLRTINGKQYYFRSNGKLLTDKTAYKIKGTYYTINSKGVAKKAKTSSVKVQCSIKTQEFIAAHTTSGMSKAEKFRACFNYIIAYTRYRSGYYKLTDEQISAGTWPYTIALQMLNTNLTGNCYGIASLVASCAKELGYSPYVIAITAQHGFVMINGKYYDNMGARFGTDQPAIYPYTVRSKVKF